MSDRRFHIALLAILLGGFVLRLAYVLAQPANDPYFAHPAFDGAYYVDWARAIAAGEPGPGGAFYLAPLYPYIMAALMKLPGGGFGMLYLLQHLLGVGAAAVIALAGRRTIGAFAALAAAVLFLLYHPIIFFASRPLGEALALFLLICSFCAVTRRSHASGAVAGLLAGLAAVARPNLLLAPLLWTVGEGIGGRWKRASLIAACTALVILPWTVRNFVVSGHAVLISSNGGITAYHGNGPGALGVFTLPQGFSGEVNRQRQEATLQASIRSGEELDAVEADGWWGRQAIRERLAAPGGSLLLLAKRCLLTLDNHEHGLDYAPSLDGNRWRLFAVVPFALLAGLAAAGVLIRGFKGSGGWALWGALLACAAVPVLFYVSSRYRLPFAAVLVIPAGCGLAGLLGLDLRTSKGRRWAAAAAGAVICLVSLMVPFDDLKRAVEAQGLAHRALYFMRAGDLDRAEQEARRALGHGGLSSEVLYNSAVVLAARGLTEEAEALHRRALEADPDNAEAAADLSAMLSRRGRFDSAAVVLEQALRHRPDSETCWNNLVVAYMGLGDTSRAREAAARAAAVGVMLDEALLLAIERLENGAE
jgi:tetratricopeptide (TPR) repeat protein